MGVFINFTALHLCVLSGPHTEPALPSWSPSLAPASPRANNLPRDENNYLHRFQTQMNSHQSIFLGFKSSYLL